MAKVISVDKKTATSKTIKKVLISQAKPESERSPYFDLASKYKVDLHFHPLIQLVAIPSKEFRKSKIEIPNYSAVIFTSKNAIDHFFRTCDELKVSVSQSRWPFIYKNLLCTVSVRCFLAPTGLIKSYLMY